MNEEKDTHSQLVTIIGCIEKIRNQGKMVFLDLMKLDSPKINTNSKSNIPWKGMSTVQVLIRRDTLGNFSFENIKSLSIGERVRIEGCSYLSRRGESSIALKKWEKIEEIKA